MRDRFPVAERIGNVQIPFSLFVNQFADKRMQSVDSKVYYQPKVSSLINGLVTKQIEWRVTQNADGTIATETITLSRNWFGIVLVGILFVLGGQITSIYGITGVTAVTTAFGLFLLLLATAIATPSGSLPRKQVSLTLLYYPQLGVLSVIWIGSLVTIVLGGRLGVVCSVSLWVVWLIHGFSTRVQDVLEAFTQFLSDYGWRLPALPTRYVLLMATATTALTVFCLLNVQIVFTQPAQSMAAMVLTIAVVIFSLSVARSGWQARVGVLIATGISGLFILSLPFQLSAAIRPLTVASSLEDVLFGVTAVLLAISWITLWYALFSSQTLTRERFLESGREITTSQAAVAAYLMITTAGCFLSVTLGSLIVAWTLLQQSLQMSVWFLSVSLMLPALYLVTGSLYQLSQLATMVWQIRTRTDRTLDPAAHDLPFKPDYPVWVLEEDKFYAGAYWDPLDHGIVISTGAIEELTGLELAAIIAHEESHFEYRGAQLQFAFALAPAFAFMGKNVVYSIYDFYERELTADAYAIQRLNEAMDRDDASDVLVDVLRKFIRNDVTQLEGSVLTFLPTLQTSATTQPMRRGIEQIFDAFYGHFAGAVHPSNDERIRAIRAREAINEDLSPTERPNED